VQFHEFIVSNLDLISFERLLPRFETMVKEYGIEPPVAFYLWRPILAEKIRQYDVDLSIQLKKQKLIKGLAASERSIDVPDDRTDSFPSTFGSEVQDTPLFAAMDSENPEAIRGDSPPLKLEE
jgi:THO complex subunit 2